MTEDRIEKRLQRRKRVRARVRGTAAKPRLNVFRSNKHVFVQIIDDVKGVTLASLSDIEVKMEGGKKGQGVTKKSIAFEVGEALAKKALAKKIQKIVFDKSGYKYHGRVKEVAQGARKGGLEF